MAKTQPCAAQVIRSTRGRSACPERDKPWVLAAAVLGSTMAFVDESVVNVALPTIEADLDRKSTRLNSSHLVNSYAVFCLKKKNNVIRVNRAEIIGMFNITSRDIKRERTGRKIIHNALNPLFIIYVTMMVSKLNNVYSRVKS